MAEHGKPDAHAFDAERVRVAIAACAHLDGPLLPILHEIQKVLGWVPDAAVPLVAEALNLSRAEVHGVISFYHDFRRSPPARHALRICRAEACQSMGGERLAAHAVARLGIDFHQQTADGRVGLEPVYCLGNCAAAPAAMLDGRLVGRVTPERLDALLADPEAI
jgi:formate dehydrogenase subunit gamma